MSLAGPRVAVRAVLVQENQLLLVNAYPDGQSDLWCAPGGGVESGSSLSDNLIREVHEETGLTIAPGPLCHVSEFHNPETGYHQVDLFFLARLTTTDLRRDWRDPAGVVTKRRFFAAEELGGVRFLPSVLPALAFGTPPELRPGTLARMAT